MSERIGELAGALVAQGVKAVFGVPGSGLSLQLITALEGKGVPFFGAASEGAGAIMAGAFGRQSRTLGCSISIKGPGLVNMLPGIVSNYYEQLPALSIAEAFAPAAGAARMHKRLDHNAATAFCTKAYATLGDPRATVERLAACAAAEVPGPVHLDLFAEDSPSFHSRAAPAERDSGGQAWPQVRRLVEQSRRPAVVAGALAGRRPWGARLAGLRIPVFTTLAAKGVVDETTPYAAGIFTGDGKALAPEHSVLAAADLVVGLGLRNLEVLAARPFAAPLVIVDVVGPQVAEGFGARHVVRVEQDEEVGPLFDALSAKEWGREVVCDSVQRVCRYLTRDPWLPGMVFQQLHAGLPDLGCFVVDTGSFCTVAEHVWQARSREAFCASANGRYMGTGLPMAIGVALADRTRPVVCALGDGGIRMQVAEVKLALQERLPILLLLLTDGRYGSIAGVPAAKDLSVRATTIPRPSWFRAIEALECPAAQVRDREQFATALRAWDWRAGPMFVEAVFDAERYAAMTAEVR